MVKLNCFEIKDGKPTLNLVLYDSKLKEKVIAEFIIDTGFSGWLISNYEVYKKLSSLELPVTRKYRTINGVIELYSSRVFVEVCGKMVGAILESSPYVDLNLIGREFLKNFAYIE